MTGAGLARVPVRFDAPSHTYTLPDGRTLTGVTGMMRRHGLSPDYSSVPDDVLAAAAARGSAVHGAVQDSVNGLFDPSVATEAERVAESGWLAFAAAEGLRPVEAEYLVSDMETCASKVDLVMEDCSLADIKTTSTLHVGPLRWQLSIYAWLFERQNPGLRVPRLLGLHWDVRRAEWTLHEVVRLPDSEVERLLRCEREGSVFVPAPSAEAAQAAGGALAVAVEGLGLPSLAAAVAEAKAALAAVQSRMDAAVSEVRRRMEEAGASKVSGDGWEATLRAPSRRRTLDAAALRREMPEVAARYERETEVSGGVAFRLKPKAAGVVGDAAVRQDGNFQCVI